MTTLDHVAPTGDIVEAAPGPSAPGVDYDRTTVMIPMRDGARLHTLLIAPKDVAGAPVILDRTPYGPGDILRDEQGARMSELLHPLHADLVAAGYMLAIQYVRGKHGSEGSYEMNRPICGPFNADATSHVTDGWDTIAWLAGNVVGGNGRIGALGLSYDGFTALMNLLDPHPALGACVAINAMVDGWTGDDWFHNGAFRQFPAMHYVNRQTTAKGAGVRWPSPAYDEYEAWLAAGSAHIMAERLGIAHLPAWRRLEEHPAFDAYWRTQALDQLLAERDVTVPTLSVHSQWDGEDGYGPPAVFRALHARASRPELHRFVTGPWSHACAFYTDGAELGPLRFEHRTARDFRRNVLLPFLDATLRERDGPTALAKATAYASGDERWLTFDAWPPREADTRAYHLAPGGALDRHPPVVAAGADAFVSDPAKPVTHRPRPILRKDAPGYGWETLGIIDQRFAGDRPDVLRYVSPALDAPMLIAGEPVVHLFASTEGTDADWFVKLIDVYPDIVPGDEAMGGYELALAIKGLRGRYHADPAEPRPLPRGGIVPYVIRLPHVCRTVLPRHRVMLQVQSTMFPLYDRNPQTFVASIFHAQFEDFRTATHRVFRQLGAASRIDLPVIARPASAASRDRAR